LIILQVPIQVIAILDQQNIQTLQERVRRIIVIHGRVEQRIQHHHEAVRLEKVHLQDLRVVLQVLVHHEEEINHATYFVK
jgi:hypothetical protein